MPREKKTTGDAPKKRASRKTQATAHASFPENGSEQTLKAAAAGNNGGSNATLTIIGDEAIRRRAYEIWEQRGCQHGRDADDWFRAESEIRGKSA